MRSPAIEIPISEGRRVRLQWFESTSRYVLTELELNGATISSFNMSEQEYFQFVWAVRSIATYTHTAGTQPDFDNRSR